MNMKLFSQRFNRELAGLGFPEEFSEKMKAITKVFGVNQHTANNLIFGHALPSGPLLDKIASVLEVCPHWLTGQTDKKRSYHREVEDSV